MRRLFLLGDGEVLDLLSELCGRLGYDELHRADELPRSAIPLAADDQVVVADTDARRRRDLLASALAAGEPGAGYLALCAAENEGLVALLSLSADRVVKASLDRVVFPTAGAARMTADETALLVAADLIRARHR